MPNLPDVERYETHNGHQIFRLPMEVFPGYIAYAHLICLDTDLILVDVGSGIGGSLEHLLAGFDTLKQAYGLNRKLPDVDYILITHGHVDHFGGLAQVRQIASSAVIGVHELARPALTHYDERSIVAHNRLNALLKIAGVSDEHRKKLLDLHSITKNVGKPLQADFALQDGSNWLDAIKVIHVPGHEPGQVMLQLDDILLTADHILPHTSVAIAPESMMPFLGVSHYLDSLDKAAAIPGVKLALGGHEEAMTDYYNLVETIRRSSVEKIERVFDQTAKPRSIYRIAEALYGPMDGYVELLMIEQTSARIEYLHQRGMVIIANAGDLENEDNPALLYQQC